MFGGQGYFTQNSSITPLNDLWMYSTSSICDVGFEPTSDKSGCKACSTTMYKDTVANDPCKQCPEFAVCNGFFFECKSGAEWNNSTQKCQPCPPNTFKNSQGNFSCGPTQMSQNWVLTLWLYSPILFIAILCSVWLSFLFVGFAIGWIISGRRLLSKDDTLSMTSQTQSTSTSRRTSHSRRSSQTRERKHTSSPDNHRRRSQHARRSHSQHKPHTRAGHRDTPGRKK